MLCQGFEYRRRGSWLSAGCLLAVIAVGCRPTSPPPYSRTRQLLVIEALRAFGDGDYALAERKLDRLTTVASGGADLELLRRYAQECQAVTAANEAVDNGQYAEALALLDRQIRDRGSGGIANRARDRVVALTDIAAYCQHAAVADARTRAAAAQKLPAPTVFGEDSSVYAAWFGKQQAAAQSLAREEHVRWCRELVDAADVALVAGRPELPLVLAQLGAAAPEHPYYRAWKALWAGQVTLDEAADGASGDLVLHTALLVGSDALRREAVDHVRNGQAASLSGRLGAVEAALWVRDYPTAVRGYRELRQLLPDLTGVPLADVWAGAWPEPWRAELVPSVSAVLVQLRRMGLAGDDR